MFLSYTIYTVFLKHSFTNLNFKKLFSIFRNFLNEKKTHVIQIHTHTPPKNAFLVVFSTLSMRMPRFLLSSWRLPRAVNVRAPIRIRICVFCVSLTFLRSSLKKSAEFVQRKVLRVSICVGVCVCVRAH